MKLCECGCGEPAPIARRTNATKGHVAGRPMRFIAGHNARLKRVGHVVEDRGYVTPCWIWQGGLNEKGYGRAWGGMAHRRYYVERYGPIPADLTVDHLCRVRSCVNPQHLEAVTLAENTRRGAAARAAENGEAHPLTVARIAARLSQRQLAEMLGVSQSTVSLWERGQYDSLSSPTRGVA